MDDSTLFKNPDQFTRLFQAFYTRLVLYAFRITKHHAVAEDIAEEAFLTLWDGRNIPKEIRSLKSYLYAIAKNGSLSWIRDHKRHARHQDAWHLEYIAESGILDKLVHRETMRAMMITIERLPSPCRSVLMLHYLEGKKMSAIAMDLDMSLGRAKYYKSRAIRILQQNMRAR